MDDEKWLERRCYGGDLPAEAERALHAVGLCWEDDAAAEAQVLRALAPDHLAVHYGAYKLYYYKHRLPDALPQVEARVADAIRRNGLPRDWRAVTPEHADLTHFDGEPRVFLLSLRARGWLLTRLGRIDEGRAALEKVMSLDPDDQMRARRLLADLDARDEEEGAAVRGVGSALTPAPRASDREPVRRLAPVLVAWDDCPFETAAGPRSESLSTGCDRLVAAAAGAAVHGQAGSVASAEARTA